MIDQTDDFLIVVNDVGQHSLWIVGRKIPTGWNKVFGPASKDECLGYVREAWPDIRRLSVGQTKEGC
jgi:MbtH protein